MKNDDITNMTDFELDPANPPKTDWTRFDAMTQEERHVAALSDPDALPASQAQLGRARRAPDIKAIRRGLNLTQEEFATQFELSLGAVRDWEQGSHHPDRAARALLKVIACNPKAVLDALRQR
jgi:putative transcriptional regulator